MLNANLQPYLPQQSSFSPLLFALGPLFSSPAPCSRDRALSPNRSATPQLVGLK